jgi:hypothetical protein
MRDQLVRPLDSPRVTLWAAASSLALGFFFTFVWAPHPWGWAGIDQYHELARALARGEPFGTTDVPWGYAYFVAAFYAVFGERPWLPVVVQVFANATVPVLLYRLVQPLVGTRTAALASLLIGVFSFNTIYASTQASDAICTVLFMLSLVLFAKAHETGRTRYFVLSGLIAGLVPQFRPNMILFPLVMAAVVLVAGARTKRTVLHLAMFVVLVAAALAPWTWRNYRLTGMFLPTSTHGGVQLWYGSLQVGPYLESRAYNPRSAFEPSTFPYTSIVERPIIVEANRRECVPRDASIRLVYWTDHDARRIELAPTSEDETRLVFEMPGQPAPTVVYYLFHAPGAVATPTSVYFVSTDHLGDLDRRGDLLDIFDVVRMMRHANSRSDESNLKQAVVRLLGDGATADDITGFDVTADARVLRLADGTRLVVPATFSGRITDLEVQGALDRALLSAHRPMVEPLPLPPRMNLCHPVGEVRLNDVFYRKEPHDMRRYIALAADNISRDPAAFAAASAYRAIRLFVMRGVGDRRTAQQFSGSRFVYLAGLVLSVSYLVVFLAGVFIAWKRHRALLVLLIPIVYVPLTICFVLTNMRYTITVQPLMFAFVALAIAAALRLDNYHGLVSHSVETKSARASAAS